MNKKVALLNDVYLEPKNTGFIQKLISIFLFLYLFQASILYVQLELFGKLIVDSQSIKYLLGFILFLCLIILSIVSKLTIFRFQTALFYILFLYISFISILLNSDGFVLQSFLYNYSLTIFLFFIVLFLAKNDIYTIHLTQKTIKLLSRLFLLISMLALYELFSQDYLFSSIQAISIEQDIIKFDQINGYIRLNSIFKSPIDYSLINGIFSGLFLALYFEKRKSSYFIIWLLLSFLQFAILVRSGIVLWIVMSFIIFISYTSKNNKIIMLNIFIFLFILAIFGMLVTDISLFDPQNLFIRLSNWSLLLSDFASSSTLNHLFGFGIVQNGSFGDQNSIIIDSLYIGILYTGGLIGLILFLITITFLLSANKKSDKLAIWKNATIYAFLCAGIFENVMHIFYLSLIPLLFSLKANK